MSGEIARTKIPSRRSTPSTPGGVGGRRALEQRRAAGLQRERERAVGGAPCDKGHAARLLDEIPLFDERGRLAARRAAPPRGHVVAKHREQPRVVDVGNAGDAVVETIVADRRLSRLLALPARVKSSAAGWASARKWEIS